MSDNNLNSIT